MTSTKKDPLTGEDFTPKRANQVFANSANRIKFNNKKATIIRKNLEYINKPVTNNFKILNELIKDNGETTFHRQFLLGKGFNFNVLTHYHEFNKKHYPCIYNFMIIYINKDSIKIKKYDRFS